MRAQRWRNAAGLAAVVTALTVLPAHAAVRTIDVEFFAYTPPSPRYPQGTTVRWEFKDTAAHTSTSNQGFWASPQLADGGAYQHTATFRNAGTYRYHCELHSSMNARVRVPVRASGAPADGWRIRWSSAASTPQNRRYDVQVKGPGATPWRAYRTNVRTRSAFFNPDESGKYRFRARMDNLDTDQSSSWSPPRAVTVS